MSDRIFTNCLRALVSPVLYGHWEIKRVDAHFFIDLLEYFVQHPSLLHIWQWQQILETYWLLFDVYIQLIQDGLGEAYRKSVLSAYDMSVDLTLSAKYERNVTVCENLIWCSGLLMTLAYTLVTPDISPIDHKNYLMTTKFFSSRTCPTKKSSILNILCTYQKLDILGIIQNYILPRPQMISILMNEGEMGSMDFDGLVFSPIDSLTTFIIMKGDQSITSEERLELEACAHILSVKGVPSNDDFDDIIQMIRTYGKDN